MEHERADDVAAASENPSWKANPSPEFVRSIEADVGQKLSRSDLAYCAELERRGIAAETVCAGVVVGRARKFCSDTNRGISDPPRSLRYFDGCIEQAARSEFSADYVDLRRRWLIRHGVTRPSILPTAENVDEVQTPAARAYTSDLTTDQNSVCRKSA